MLLQCIRSMRQTQDFILTKMHEQSVALATLAAQVAALEEALVQIAQGHFQPS